ncbi:hypothetical protein ACKWTF_014644 [Chironomus riparius]
MASKAKEFKQSEELKSGKSDVAIAGQCEDSKEFKTEIVWRNVIIFALMHYWAYQVRGHATWGMIFFHTAIGILTGYGIVVGAHRLWAHRSFKANYKLQMLLMILQTAAVENDVIEWVRDHRVHHKFSDTNADPTNSNRGLFFSHMGWLMCKKHPDVRKYGSKVDMSDIESDPLLQFQRKYYIPLVLLISFFIPMAASMYIFSVSMKLAFYSVMARYVISLHVVWLTNSAAHYGTWKPYDKNIAPADSWFFGTLCYGEGWHNFHHTFPWDYKVSETNLYRHNFGMIFIDFFAWLGWATDLKVASNDLIRKRVMRTGDGTHPYAVEEALKMKKLGIEKVENNNNNNNNNNEEDIKTCWGLGDKDMPFEDIRGITTYCTKIE